MPGDHFSGAPLFCANIFQLHQNIFHALGPGRACLHPPSPRGSHGHQTKQYSARVERQK